MKIKKEITKRANDAISNFRAEIIKAIIDACKQTGIENQPDIHFTRPVIIHTTKTKKAMDRYWAFETETIFANGISWNPEQSFFMLSCNGEYVRSSYYLSLDALCIVFCEMENVIKNINTK